MSLLLGADVAEILTVPSQARTFKQNFPVGTNYDNAQQKHGHAPAHICQVLVSLVYKSINFIYVCCNGLLKSMHRDKDIHVSFRLEPKRKINTNAVRHLRKASLFHPGGQQDILFSLYGVGNKK